MVVIQTSKPEQEDVYIYCFNKKKRSMAEDSQIQIDTLQWSSMKFIYVVEQKHHIGLDTYSKIMVEQA